MVNSLPVYLRIRPLLLLKMVSLRLSTTQNERINRFLELYSSHRPVIQRAMNVFFVIYVLGATYTSFNSAPGRVGKSRAKKSSIADDRKGKQERVAVCHFRLPAKSSSDRVLGRRNLLSTTQDDIAHHHTWSAL